MKASRITRALYVAALTSGALFLLAVFRDPVQVDLGPGKRRILCLGDANTFGLYLGRSDAYPEQLEAIWNAAPENPKVEVLNLSYPGANSSWLLRDFPRMLETFRPDLVIVLIGATDHWTVPLPSDPEQEWARRSFLEVHSHAYKLFSRLWRALEASQIEIDFNPAGNTDPGTDPNLRDTTGTARFGEAEFALSFAVAAPGTLTISGSSRRLNANVRLLAEQAEAFGAELWLLTYPSASSVYTRANKVIRRAAAASTSSAPTVSAPSCCCGTSIRTRPATARWRRPSRSACVIAS